MGNILFFLPDLKWTESENVVPDFISAIYSVIISNSVKDFPELTLQFFSAHFRAGCIKDFGFFLTNSVSSLFLPILMKLMHFASGINGKKNPTSRSSKATFHELWHNNLLTAEFREGQESVTLQSLCRGREKSCDVRNIRKLHHSQNMFT